MWFLIMSYVLGGIAHAVVLDDFPTEGACYKDIPAEHVSTAVPVVFSCVRDQSSWEPVP